MRANENILNEIERLLQEYEIEVEAKRTAGELNYATAKTYLRHANTFVRWCKGDFAPGEGKR